MPPLDVHFSYCSFYVNVSRVVVTLEKVWDKLEMELCPSSAANMFQKVQLLFWRQTVPVSGLWYNFLSFTLFVCWQVCHFHSNYNRSNMLATKAMTRMFFAQVNTHFPLVTSGCQGITNWFVIQTSSNHLQLVGENSYFPHVLCLAHCCRPTSMPVSLGLFHFTPQVNIMWFVVTCL